MIPDILEVKGSSGETSYILAMLGRVSGLSPKELARVFIEVEENTKYRTAFALALAGTALGEMANEFNELVDNIDKENSDEKEPKKAAKSKSAK